MTQAPRPARHENGGDSGRPARSGGQPPSRQQTIKQQIVAGFVIYRRTHDGIKFLLLYRRGNYWNFPKGHFEHGERDLDTALRETEEETGLKKSDLRIIPNFRAYERFSFRRGHETIHDTVILFLAETRNPNVRLVPREHSGFAWFLYRDAMHAIGGTYLETKKVLKQANDFLHKRGPRRGPENSAR
ncbi:MAG: NUDIX domain-containing protein [bacterium]|nr:NUDIX domain-containing protein [bacterium]